LRDIVKPDESIDGAASREAIRAFAMLRLGTNCPTLACAAIRVAVRACVVWLPGVAFILAPVSTGGGRRHVDFIHSFPTFFFGRFTRPTGVLNHVSFSFLS